MTKTKNRKGKKKHMKHLDNVAARSATVQSKPEPQFATLGSASTSAVVTDPLSDFLEEHVQVTHVAVPPAPIPDSIEDAYEEPLAPVDDPALNGQDADFEAKAYAAHDAALAVLDAIVDIVDIDEDVADLPTAEDVADVRRADLGQINITDLRKYSKGSGIPGAYGLKKPDLIEAIIAAGWYNS